MTDDMSYVCYRRELTYFTAVDSKDTQLWTLGDSSSKLSTIFPGKVKHLPLEVHSTVSDAVRHRKLLQ